MRIPWSVTVVVLAASLCGAAVSRSADEPPPRLSKKDPAAKADGRAGLPWLPALADGYTDAQRRRQPLFVRFSSATCPWCRKLEGELAKPGVQEELARWTLVGLDVDRAAKDAEALAVAGVPALRLLTPAGRLVASHDGYLEGDKLTSWLKGHCEAASAAPRRELTDGGVPDLVAVGRLVGELNRREPAVREAAIRRLLPHHEAAARPVAEAFARGGLQTRLGALELLRDWKAPVDGLDPWRPDTLTGERLKALREWAGKTAKPGPAENKGLAAEQLAAARQEIARMAEASDAEAIAARERLARHGAALLPEVFAQLKQATTERARERLTALRYRLVADTALVLEWPGGLERLAATTAPTRQQAAQELAARATPADEPLLLELFGSPDPLVREISLRALQEVTEGRTTAALAKLLRDPEPNVRAAVLKQLAEQPSTQLVPRLVEYVAAETDPDLLVHAVRVLKAAPSKPALECLQGLLAHEELWRVRAEAAESLGKMVVGSGSVTDDLKSDICVALINLLKDPDAFVVSRAVGSLQATGLAVAVDPLAETARKHPELAAEVVKALSYGDALRAKAVPHLKQFCTDPNPDVRAAAVTGLCASAPHEIDQEVRAALKDKDSSVRRAAAAGVYQMIQSRRHDVQRVATSSEDNLQWLEKFRKGRPKELFELAPLLEPLLAAEAPAERIAAGLPLALLGQEDRALPVLAGAARAGPDELGQASHALSWLAWPRRLELFNRLVALGPAPEELAGAIAQLSALPDRQAAVRLWELADDAKVTPEVASAIALGLTTSLVGNQGYRDDGSISLTPADRKEVLKVLNEKAASGPEMQRLIALTVLHSVSLEDAVAAAGKIKDDPKNSPALRRDAFQMLLLSCTRAESRRRAIAAFGDPEPGVRNLAVRFLALGTGEAYHLRGEGWQVYVRNPSLNDPHGVHSHGGGAPIRPEAPEGLKPEAVRPLLQDPDPQTAAAAGYLLALLGDPDGLESLLRYWRGQGRGKDTWVRLVYQAVAALNDDGRVRILEELYRALGKEHSALRDFYWTIRVMDGPQALKLRKRIRQEAGMERLR